MQNNYQQKTKIIIENIVKNLEETTAEDENLVNFTKYFYSSLSLADLSEVPLAIAHEIARENFAHFKQLKSEASISINASDFMKNHYGRGRLCVSVLNSDKPFLVDSLSIALKNLGFSIYRIIHPQLHSKRDELGNIVALSEVKAAGFSAESYIYFELSTLPAGMSEDGLKSHILRNLEFISAAVNDWRIMLAKAREAATNIASFGTDLDAQEHQEASDFFDWLLGNNFIFLGHTQYSFYNSKGEAHLSHNEGSELGICKVENSHLIQKSGALPQEMQYFANNLTPVQISKFNKKSMVHRDVLLDCISVKIYDKTGKTIGENRFLGLFTSPVYYQQTNAIPYIRRKVARVTEASCFEANGHSGKALRAALEFFPRDEMFQIDEETLLEITLGIVSLEERPDVRIFLIHDKFGKSVTCFVYMPRDRFNTFVRQEIAELLEKTLSGSLDMFFVQLTDSPLARVIYTISINGGSADIAVNMEELTEKLRFIINYWVASLREALQDQRGENIGEKLFQQFMDSFPRHYINSTPIAEALIDISNIEQMIESSRPNFRLFDVEGVWHLKMISDSNNAALSDILPPLENMGFKVYDVVPHEINIKVEKSELKLLMRDFTIKIPQKSDVSIDKIKHIIEDMLTKVWLDEIENDKLNALCALSGLEVRQIMLLRAYTHYALQAEIGYSQHYIEETLCKHANISRLLIALFTAKFSPESPQKRDERINVSRETLLDNLSEVENIAEDKIIRFIIEAIMASLRTNYFQFDENGNPKDYISFKLDSHKVPNLPKPVPFREIFVYSSTTEGIHLRGGKVARGGLRWSDRHQDFRTEVLSLMKAQIVKNTVIVPTGSKGGFVSKAKLNSSDRAAKLEAGIASYKQFLSGLLDITDNRIGAEIIPPERVVRYDDDDPYLVVAADKGTATFSDIANGVARNYGFWLDDAFASGGSVGYDHKKMGITARGAWISVEQHFNELGYDIAQNNFSVAGIGDMSGDVFGNGMLLSDKILLKAAFNHLHIFLDPTPDAQTSFIERKRLFELAKGSWDEYDASLISKGGGVYSRSAKSIPLSLPVQKFLGVNAAQLAPNELIKLILKAEVDLLWNGGIGTYVKASYEGHDAAGDPSNNALRINANEIRAKIIGEGGNLGLTQNARIEFANSGGKVNSDAIDNSAGVDCSDHEVNIKIAVGGLVSGGKITIDERNKLLASMTDDVAELVLQDNKLQNLALSISESRAPARLELHSRFIRELERKGLLDRTVEYLPSDKALNDLKAEKKGLTRPELAVLLAYGKIDLYHVLSQSILVNSPIYQNDLMRYFPKQLQENYAEALKTHPLRAELVATCLTNEIINRAGITYIFGINNDTGHEVCNIVRSYTVVREIFALEDIWQQIEALKGSAASNMMIELFTHVTQFLKRMSIWFLNNTIQPLEMEQVIAQYKSRIAAYRLQMSGFVSGAAHEWRMGAKNDWLQRGIPAKLAEEIVGLEGMISACDIAMLDDQLPQDLETIGKVYYTIGTELQLSWLRVYLREFISENHWDRLAVASAINELYEQQRRLTSSVVNGKKNNIDISLALQEWRSKNSNAVERFDKLVYDIKASKRHDMSIIMVALRQLGAIK